MAPGFLCPEDCHVLEGLCRDLVRIPSPSGDEGGVAARLAQALSSFGWADVHVDSMGSLSARIGSGKPPVLVFNGHMDHVDAGDLSLWTQPPFAGHVENGVLCGRGACDMKGGLAALAYSGSLLRSAVASFQGTLYLVAVVHEETCEGVAMAHWMRALGVRPDYVLLGEPSDLKLALGHRGRAEITVRTHGRSAHGSAPERGDNAIYHMAKAALAVDELNSRLPNDHRLGKGSIAVTTISGGAGINVVPATCLAQVDRRLTTGETASGAVTELQRAAESAGVSVDVEVLEYAMSCYTGSSSLVKQEYAPWYTPSDHPLARALAASAESVSGRAPGSDVWAFSTDGAYTSGVAGIPTIGFGPGEERFAHVADEQVRLADVSLAAPIYARLAADLLA
jgi:putative selenium metabolism hydrolase